MGETFVVPLLSPIQGRWVFDAKQTQAANGWPQPGDNLPDLSIAHNVAVGGDGSEYWFFGLHEHDGVICGKAWYHEDRNDPGDMWKCHVRIECSGDRLVLHDFNRDDVDTTADPDFIAMWDMSMKRQTMMPLVNAPANQCDAPPPAGEDGYEWYKYVFVRP
jgi:hypothetical protein